MKFFLILLLPLFFAFSCVDHKWQVKITSPNDGFVLPTDEAKLAEASGKLVFTKDDEKEMKKTPIKGAIHCNGVPGTINAENRTWAVRNIVIHHFNAQNLVCTYTEPQYSTMDKRTIISKAQEVPDPGPAGTKTLAGIDTDKNGIRDDAQVWINKNYTDPDLKNALKQVAKYSQKALIEHENKTKSIANTKAQFKALHCLVYITNDVYQTNELDDKLDAIMFNTKERLQAEFKNNDHFNGQFVSVPDPIATDCEFTITSKKQVGGK